MIDCWLLLQPPREFNWNYLIQACADNHLALPLLAGLTYLQNLEISVPPQVLNAVANSVKVDSREDEMIIAMHLHARNSLRLTWFAVNDSPRLRGAFIKFVLLPSSDYLDWRYFPAAKALHIFRHWRMVVRSLFRH